MNCVRHFPAALQYASSTATVSALASKRTSGMSGGDPAARTIAEILSQALHLGISRIAFAILDAVARVVGNAGLVGNAAQIALVGDELFTDVIEEV